MCTMIVTRDSKSTKTSKNSAQKPNEITSIQNKNTKNRTKRMYHSWAYVTYAVQFGVIFGTFRFCFGSMWFHFWAGFFGILVFIWPSLSLKSISKRIVQILNNFSTNEEIVQNMDESFLYPLKWHHRLHLFIVCSHSIHDILLCSSHGTVSQQHKFEYTGLWTDECCTKPIKSTRRAIVSRKIPTIDEIHWPTEKNDGTHGKRRREIVENE